MDPQNSSLFKTHSGFFNMGAFPSPRISSLVAYFLTLFAFIKQYFFSFCCRLKEKFIPEKQNSKSVLIQPREEEGEQRKQTDSNKTGKEMESFLSFRFRTYEEFIGKNSDDQVPTGDSDDEFFEVESMEDDEAIIENSAHSSVHVEEIEESEISPEINHCNNSVHVEEIEEPQTNTETQGSADNSVIVEGTEEDSPEVSSELESSQRNVVNVPVVTEVENSQRNAVNVPVVSDAVQNSEEVKVENDVVQNSEEVKVENEAESLKDSANNGHLFRDDDELLVSDSESDSMVSSSKFSFRSSIIDSMSDGFLSDIDFDKAFEVAFDGEEAYSGKKVLTEEDIEFENLNRGYETDDFEDEDEEILKELKNLERQTGANEERKLEDEEQPSQPPKRRVSFAEDRAEDKQNPEKPNSREHSGENPRSEEQNGEKPSSGEQFSSDSEEQSELESQWEHQDLVEQLKMEIKKLRDIGLPTILEESESLKITEDLKPWKIEEKFHHEDTMDELHKFYKSYRERMRKLDIFNYQKMYAIGFLRGKDPLQSFTRNKLSAPAMAAIVSLDCWSCTGKSAIAVQQPVMKKFSRELESDLEMVYVGQMCLSWEFLRWQHDKALKLWDSDVHGIRRYNEVADKFQQFQVLLTRFLEDEPFQQGPRIRHYFERRCGLRNLLQVPVIREDNLRDKKKERRWVSRKDAITSAKLVETIEDSIRIMWQFIRSDKSTISNAILSKCKRGSDIELQNPADAVLLEQIRSTLQKKEKKLKELRKCENCILRKIQKLQHSEEGSDQVDYFFSQVDLKLVSRVLNMSRITTEQLGWCSDKLNTINVVGGKLYVKPSFLLFPCS